MYVCCSQSLSSIRLFVAPWTGACQAPLSMEILQARILEWVAMPFSRGSAQPRDRNCVSQIPSTGRQVLYHQRHLGIPGLANDKKNCNQEFCYNFYCNYLPLLLGFLGGSVVKNPPANAEDAGDMGQIPGLGGFPGGENDYPLLYSCLENHMYRGDWWTTIHWVAESDTTEYVSQNMYYYYFHPLIMSVHCCSLYVINSRLISLIRLSKAECTEFQINTFSQSKVKTFIQSSFHVMANIEMIT